VARAFWDTNLFIYLFEKNAEWSPRVIELRRGRLASGSGSLTVEKGLDSAEYLHNKHGIEGAAR